jgi:hypothetical protein
MNVLRSELVVIFGAHLLALIPICGLMIAGRMSPLYQVPSEQLARWWAWFALVIVVVAFLGRVVANYP